MSSPTPEQVRDWANKWLKGTLTTEERRLFEDWYRQQPPETVAWMNDTSETVLKDRLFANITTRLDLPPLVKQHTLSIRRYATAAAAAVILILTGTYLWPGHPARPVIAARLAAPAPRPGSDLLPGSNKATLTLGNGSIITLDGTATGALAQQGNTRVTNNAAGELTYDPASAATTANAALNTVFYNTITTARGGQYRLRLPDGTTVWLNASSSLHFPTAFIGDTRTVELKGEAYFEVAKNATAPFHVKLTDGNDIEVLGTGFNVNAYEDESLIRTTLVEGAVRIRNPHSTVTLHPGQQAQQNNTIPIRVKDNAGVREAIAWKDNLFYFKSADIHTIMRQISRWYDVEVEYRDNAGNAVPRRTSDTGNAPNTGATSREARFNAEIPRNTPAADILTALELTGKVKFNTTINKKIIVTMN
jgi:transmembrane sensor